MPKIIKPLRVEELDALKHVKTGREWDNTCDAIKKARGGYYPPDWFQKVLASGLAAKVLTKAGKDPGLKVTVYNEES
jgi:hypothetical protein